MKQKIIARTGGLDLALKCLTPTVQEPSSDCVHYKGSGLSQVPIAVAKAAAVTAVTAVPIAVNVDDKQSQSQPQLNEK